MKLRVSRLKRALGKAFTGGRLEVGTHPDPRKPAVLRCVRCLRVVARVPRRADGKLLWVGRRRLSHKCKGRAA